MDRYELKKTSDGTATLFVFTLSTKKSKNNFKTSF